MIPDIEITAFQFRNGQVIAKGARGYLFSQLLRPPGIVRTAVDVDRLVRPAVMLLAGDEITGDAERANMNRTLHREFVDPGGFQLWAVLLSLLLTDVDTD